MPRKIRTSADLTAAAEVRRALKEVRRPLLSIIKARADKSNNPNKPSLRDLMKIQAERMRGNGGYGYPIWSIDPGIDQIRFVPERADWSHMWTMHVPTRPEEYPSIVIDSVPPDRNMYAGYGATPEEAQRNFNLNHVYGFPRSGRTHSMGRLLRAAGYTEQPYVFLDYEAAIDYGPLEARTLSSIYAYDYATPEVYEHQGPIHQCNHKYQMQGTWSAARTRRSVQVCSRCGHRRG